MTLRLTAILHNFSRSPFALTFTISESLAGRECREHGRKKLQGFPAAHFPSLDGIHKKRRQLCKAGTVECVGLRGTFEMCQVVGHKNNKIKATSCGEVQRLPPASGAQWCQPQPQFEDPRTRTEGYSVGTPGVCGSNRQKSLLGNLKRRKTRFLTWSQWHCVEPCRTNGSSISKVPDCNSSLELTVQTYQWKCL